jgi:hypothetical protein
MAAASQRQSNQTRRPGVPACGRVNVISPVAGRFTGILELFFGTDELDFSISSGAAGLTVNPRQYLRSSQAAQEVVEVRILQGIHFRAADEQGRRQGRRVAHWTFSKFLKPAPGTN